MKQFILKYRRYVCIGVILAVCLAAVIVIILQNQDNRVIKEQQKLLIAKKEAAQQEEREENKEVEKEEATISESEEREDEEASKTENEVSSTDPKEESELPEQVLTPTPLPVPVMLPEYEVLYGENSDIIGWLSIEGTKINYPVMQTPEDEQYYLKRDFYGEANKNGCLIMDTDSTVGIGTSETGYAGGTKPSTNLIIHGHTMKSGLMFGKLNLYEAEDYGKEHRTICFDSLYEKREYELISVMYSQVYKKSDKVFKYYQFFQASSEEEFNEWYRNIKGRALYDTGVTAEFGDEFITLSCCSYHVEDGRLAVVGKRVK